MPADPSPINTNLSPPDYTNTGDAFTQESIPIWSDITGANSRANIARQNYAQQQALHLWGMGQYYAPSAKDISQPYNYDASDAGLQQIIDSRGLTPGAKSAYQAMAQQAGQQAAAQRQAIQQQMVARGIGASGANYAAQLQAGQAGADTAAMGGYGAVAQGEQARNAAIGAQAQLRAQQRAAYAQAQERGLQDVYQNYLQLAAGATGQYGGAANMYGQRAQQSDQNNAALLSTVGTIAVSGL